MDVCSWPPALRLSANIKRACLSGQSLPTGGIGVNEGRGVCAKCRRGGGGLGAVGGRLPWWGVRPWHCATNSLPPGPTQHGIHGPAAILAVVSEKRENWAGRAAEVTVMH